LAIVSIGLWDMFVWNRWWWFRRRFDNDDLNPGDGMLPGRPALETASQNPHDKEW
jgi:hypothetical protein